MMDFHTSDDKFDVEGHHHYGLNLNSVRKMVQLHDFIPLLPPQHIPSAEASRYDACRDYIQGFARDHGYEIRVLQGKEAKGSVIFRCDQGSAYRQNSTRQHTDCPFRIELKRTESEWVVTPETDVHNHGPKRNLLPHPLLYTLPTPFRVHARQTRSFITAHRPNRVRGVPRGFTYCWNSNMAIEKEQIHDRQVSADVYTNISQREMSLDSELIIQNLETSPFQLPLLITAASAKSTAQNQLTIEELLRDERQDNDTQTRLSAVRTTMADINTDIEELTLSLSTHPDVTNTVSHCPICKKPLDPRFLARYNSTHDKSKRRTVSGWFRFCEEHEGHDNTQLWKSFNLPLSANKTPFIDLRKLTTRSESHLLTVYDYLFEAKAASVFETLFTERMLGKLKTVTIRKAYNAVLLDDWSYCVGFYGAEAWSAISPIVIQFLKKADYGLLPRSSALLEAYAYANLVNANIHSHFVDYVFVPEVLVCIIMEDFELEREAAILMLRSTASLWMTAKH